MIVGLTGTGFPFPRLVSALADYARATSEPVWVQHGVAELPSPLKGEALVPRAELLAKMKEADVIARFDPTEMDDRLRNHNAELETTLQEREKEERNLQVALKQLRLDLVKAEGELKELELDLEVPDSLVPKLELEQQHVSG